MLDKIDQLYQILNTRTKKKIIQLLSSFPDNEWYGVEIASKIKVTPASIYQQIEELKTQGILIEVKKGRMRFFKLNPNHWLIKQLG